MHIKKKFVCYVPSLNLCQYLAALLIVFVWLVDCQAKSAKKTVRFAEVLCHERSESYHAEHNNNNMLFYPAPPQRNKRSGACLRILLVH